MTLLIHYPSKKVLRECVGQPLRYTETSIFGSEYRNDGWLTCARRPHVEGGGREFFARVKMQAGKIAKVE